MSSDALRQPPSADSTSLGTALALLAHVLLVAGLAYGVRWHRHDVSTVSAELWSAVPQIAAAPAAAPPPPAPPPPAPAPPAPRPAPPPPPREADIATERQARRAAEERAKAEAAARDKAAREAEAKAAAARDKAASDRAAKAEEQRIQKQRQDNLARLQKALGAGSAPDGSTTTNGRGPVGSTGTAAQSMAPSAGYEGRIRARILPNIVYTGQVSGHPTAVVEVRVAIDGTIIGRRLLKSSGVTDWDQAVLRAIDRTEVLPRDVDGRVPPLMELSFDPNRR